MLYDDERSVAPLITRSGNTDAEHERLIRQAKQCRSDHRKILS
jgi:hypothetical protein